MLYYKFVYHTKFLYIYSLVKDITDITNIKDVRGCPLTTGSPRGLPRGIFVRWWARHAVAGPALESGATHARALGAVAEALWGSSLISNLYYKFVYKIAYYG